jgi:PH domain
MKSSNASDDEGAYNNARRNGTQTSSDEEDQVVDSTRTQSTAYHSSRSNASDAVSRFPYHHTGTTHRRARSDDGTGDYLGNNSDHSFNASMDRLDREMDESNASLVIQDSTTFPESYSAQSNCWNFAMEHRIFLKAVLELIAQRDMVATEVGMNDPNVLKSGPLKKASHLMRGIWKVKYVEIRRGMFSYYEDAASGGKHLQNSVGAELLRKNLPLEANSCQCRAVRLHQQALNITPRGAIFEIAVHGRPKRLWMANSREERQAWIQAIHDAMVGGSVTRGGNPAKSSASAVDSRSPYKDDVKKYQKVQGLLRNSKCKDDYVVAIRQIYRYDLNVPVKWIMKQSEQENKATGAGGGGDVKGAFHEEDVKSSVDQLFKDLQRDIIKINDDIYHGNSGHAPERIMGALAREIMRCGRRPDASYEDDDKFGDGKREASKYDMSESQALAYARDVLLSGNRTRSGGDSYFCVNTLCKNADLVVLVPSSTEAEPVSIRVTREDDIDATHPDSHAKSGWLRTRRRKKNNWGKSYFELSEGTLSFYEKALPRPHGLQGQLAILDANISIEREEQKGSFPSGNKIDSFVITIVTKDKAERQILLEGEERMLVWAYALECSARAKGGATPAPFMKAINSMMARVPTVPMPMQMTVGRANRRASIDYLRPPALDDNSGRNEGPTTAEAALKEHVAYLGLDFDALEERLVAYASQQSNWVKASIEASTVYKICTLDPDGDENTDTWAVVDATFQQEFRVTGGPNPRIMRGEEVVRVDVTKCAPIPESMRRRRASSQTPDSPGGNTGRRATVAMTSLLRTFSDDVEYMKGSKPKT